MINSITGIDYELLCTYVTQNNNIDDSVINNLTEKIQQEAVDDVSDVANTSQKSGTDENSENGETEEKPISKQRQNAQKIIKIFMSDANFSAKYKSAMSKYGLTTNEDGSIDKDSLINAVKQTIEDTLTNSSFAKKYNSFMKKMTGEDVSSDVEDTQDDEKDLASSKNIQATIQQYSELLSNSKYSDMYQDKVSEIKNDTATSEVISSESLEDYMETNIVDTSNISTSTNSEFSYLGNEVLSLRSELQSHVSTADSVKTYDDVEEYIDYYTNLYNQITDKKEEYDKAVKTNS